VQQAIRLEKNDLTDQQLQAFKNADIPGFNLLSNIQYGLAGNQLLIDQQPSSDQGKVATAATWDKASTVTVSAAEFSAAQKQSLLGVLDQYAALTGLSFQMVDTGGQIDLGFDNLGTLSTGVVGSTTLHEDQGQIQSAQIVLENPAEDPLDAYGIYGGTQASFTQVLMHELGHALGLADNNIAGSIQNFYLDSSNQTLSDYDVQALQTLYGTAASAPVAKDRHAATVTTSALLDQLKQAMASASPFNDGMSSTSTGSFFSAQGVQGSPTVSLPSR
jgi:predicted Zn-dependent protease